MKVRELIEQLQSMNPEAEVILQEDPEGNGYRRARGADDDCYVEDPGAYRLETFTAEDLEWQREEYGYEEVEYARYLAQKGKWVVIFP